MCARLWQTGGGNITGNARIVRWAIERRRSSGRLRFARDPIAIREILYGVLVALNSRRPYQRNTRSALEVFHPTASSYTSFSLLSTRYIPSPPLHRRRKLLTKFCELSILPVRYSTRRSKMFERAESGAPQEQDMQAQEAKG